MPILALLAEAFRYPVLGQMERLETGLAETEQGPGHKELAQFIRRIKRLPAAEWEELYTRTFDLNPAVAPYIGYQIWGESAPRRNWMSRLSRAMGEQGIDLGGELPDHIVPILRYLAAADRPETDLLEKYETAVKRMTTVLSEKDPQNPYLLLLEAALESAPRPLEEPTLQPVKNT